MSTNANILDFVTEATKEQAKLRLALIGPSGSGKTFSAINILTEMGCKNIIVLDTEQGSAAKYSNSFKSKFKVVDNKFWKSNYDPRRLIVSLKQLGDNFDGVVVDSLTHFWMGSGGMLSLVDLFAKQAQARGGKYDSYGAWKQADPIYNELIQTILSLPAHFVACLRAKTDYQDQEVNGKTKKVKVGMAAQIREGFEYEFDVEGVMDMDHNLAVGKTRCSEIDGQIFHKPGANIAAPLVAWLTEGVAPAPQSTSAFVAPTAPALAADAAPTPEPQTGDLKAELLSSIASAGTKEALQALSKEANAAKANGKIAGEPWKEVLAAFTSKMKSFANGAAA